MNKKTLGIILVVLIVAVAGVVYFGYQKGLFSGLNIGGIRKDSIMGTMKEQGEKVMSTSEFIDKCKESDVDTQDMCYGLGALYYRDASFCKWIKDAEAKKKCTKENIEECYSDLKKCFGGLIPGGGTLPGVEIPGEGTIPGGGIIPGGEPAQPETTTEGQEKPVVSGKMTDEIYIEILAQSSNPLQKDPKTWASDMKDLYNKYGITREDIAAYGKELEKDPQRAGEIGMKYMKRLQELQATGK